MKINGFNELQDRLKQMQKGAEELSATKEVTLTELFTDEFLRKHTDFQSFKDFDSQKIFETYKTIEEIPDDEMDTFIVDNSKFESWQVMIDTAASEYTIKKLGFK